MPIYEYLCGQCGHKFEKLQKMNDDPLADCPECSASALKKLVSAAGFQLKGTGWYETDFKTPKSKPSEPGSSSSTEAQSSSSSDKD